ncbi:MULTISPECIES: mannose-1-phosphate guanylyltransferase [unclassified Paenibacillus]|uniref:mannose-1-phosphate guanylyltransferase n=1 Tax=unclassified Paenibacillus TaxID=185978 RepID=UPI00240600FF|nr:MULTISPECIES: mannose-1-phosphate guanylyltransferase [unclassified Paenibacillus]MDF9840206.1 mannose-1-phosphate guanylyltransferase [Paenibacillus sp. PastF-2]MDF9846788.1 mannose-1-phosphate guanylyltransferase [Paenibacillus sp. PastM-2]MDF9852863.1 mannose-1-phosphate guanylyltransferase [Paenibacillus sp. PastF-1]MDH6478632.1 mannose-1-phosphate guanylyltransferase [Paenibacillus sp. PastH-2]MDH6505870.1 mannose-1-phosphate guanylyltransferase [Paenibacillus sp. PastM-3]
MTITCVIMAGGKGERFWPKSRTNLPKQFLNISGNKSMIQQSIARLEKLIDIGQIFVVTNELYAELIKAQIPNLPNENIIIEPVGRNTAPCIGLASIIIEDRFPDSTMIVIPSDHIIENEEGFVKILETAVEVAQENSNLVTLGIQPTYPETGYGYIESTNEIQSINGLSVHKVNKFVEKPDLGTAQSYLESGNFFWNSGIFVWKIETIRSYIQKLMPEMHDILETMRTVLNSPERDTIIRTEFLKMPDQSIDYGIMEKVNNIYVIPCVFGWDDVGSWTALDRISELDENGNVIKGNILNLDTKHCIIESNGKLIATLGIENLIIVDTEDVTLICTKDKAQEVKLLLKELRMQKLEQYL